MDRVQVFVKIITSLTLGLADVEDVILKAPNALDVVGIDASEHLSHL